MVKNRMNVRWGQATSTTRVEPAPPLRRAPRSLHTGPGHGFFGHHPEVTGLRPVMLGGRFAGNYIPLRNRQLKKFMGDVDVIRRLQDVGEHSRLVATQASQSTELQQLRAHLGGHIASVPLRNMMLDRVRQLQEEMRSTDDSIERARRVINMVRPGKGLSMHGMLTSPQLEALAEHTLHLAQAAGAGTATPADIAEMRRGYARLTKLFGAEGVDPATVAARTVAEYAGRALSHLRTAPLGAGIPADKTSAT